jgi:hypothetical protein
MPVFHWQRFADILYLLAMASVWQKKVENKKPK